MDWSRLGELLIRRGALEEQRWNAARTEHQRWGGDLPRLLIDKRLVSEGILLEVLSQLYGVARVNLDELSIDSGVIALVPAATVEAHSVIPFRREGQFLDLAMENPGNSRAVDEVRVRSRHNVRTYLSGPYMIERAMARFYGKVTVGGYAVDPRVTSGSFLKADVIDLEAAERRGPRPGQPRGAAPAVRSVPTDARSADRVTALEQKVDQDHGERIAMLESLLKRDEDVLRRLFGLLVDKGIATREELQELLR